MKVLKEFQNLNYVVILAKAYLNVCRNCDILHELQWIVCRRIELGILTEKDNKHVLKDEETGLLQSLRNRVPHRQVPLTTDRDHPGSPFANTCNSHVKRSTYDTARVFTWKRQHWK